VHDEYADSVEKMSLAVAVAQSAKSYLISEFGIGEELPINLMGWQGSRLECVAQLDATWDDDELSRGDRIVQTISLMRQAWCCDAVTMFAEAYVSLKPDLTKGQSLSSIFASNESHVDECITFFHVETESEQVDVCALPFQVKPGKRVHWGVLMRSDDPKMLREQDLIKAVSYVMTQDVIDIDVVRDDMFFAAIALQCHEVAGFFIQHNLE